MIPIRTWIAALLVCAAAATAGAQQPDASPTPPTKTSVKEEMDVPTTKSAAPSATDEVATVEMIEHPLVKFVMPAVAFLAVLVIALFVIRWRKTGEIPGPPAGGTGPVAGS